MKRFLPLCVCVMLAAALTGCDEYVEFSNGSTAEYNKLKENGWIPDWVPEDADEVQSIHDLDTNQILIFCQLDSGRVKKFVSKLEADKEAVAYPTQNIASSAEWWPHDSIKQNIASGNWKVYTKNSKGSRYFITTDEINNVYIWSVGKRVDSP